VLVVEVDEDLAGEVALTRVVPQAVEDQVGGGLGEIGGEERPSRRE